MKTQKRRMGKKAIPVLAILMTSTFALGSAGLLDTSKALADTAEVSSAKKYYADYTSMEETLEAGAKLNIELASEGDILLKNRDNALPFGASVKKVSLFGIASTALQTGGGGSGSGKGVPNTVKESLEDAGFTVNPTLWSYYSNVEAPSLSSGGFGSSGETYEAPVSNLEQYTGSYNLYNDAAVIVIKRTGSEGSDLSRSNVKGHTDPTDHYLMLNDNEKDLIEHVEQYFDKVIVVINSSNAMELGELEDDDQIDGIVWIGHTGNSGIMALGKILNGEVNPSGRLVDVYAANFKQDPTWTNFGDMSQNNPVSANQGGNQGGPGGPGGQGGQGGQGGNQGGQGGPSAQAADESDAAETYDNKVYHSEKGVNYLDGAGGFGASAYFSTVEYREGIYEGYRWYETAATVNGYYKTENMPNNDYATYDVNDAYYNRDNGVVYAFGYGLSYTTFGYSNFKVTGTNEKDGTVTVNVTVTNKGDVAGKEVVQLYSNPQYYSGSIEKASANLVTFAKTDLLQPHQSQEITLTFNMQDLASFDYNDANKNGFVGYELEAGTYNLSLRSDSHNVIVDNLGDACEYEFEVPEDGNATAGTHTGWTYATDSTTGNEIKAWFSQGDRYDSLLGDGKGNYAVNIGAYVTRANFALPAAATQADRTYGDALIEAMKAEESYYAYMDKETDPWYIKADQIPSTWTQGVDKGITAADMVGVDPDDEKWVDFMNQLTYAEMTEFLTQGGNGSTAIDSVELPAIIHDDGPGQLQGGRSGGEYGTFWVSEVVIASTWNVDLAEQEGQMIGNESLFNNTTGWWGPGFNTHRSPFGGRNFEYYSSDGVQGGMIGAAVIKGATSKGVQTYLKHCVLNDQETDRSGSGGVMTIVSEQALREIYLKSFELAFKAGANATMTAYNRIGRAQASSNGALLNEVIRGEWGCNISTITDMYNLTYTYPDLFVRTGGCFALNGMGSLKSSYFSGVWNADQNTVLVKADADATTETVASPTQWYWVRTAAQRAIYVAVNSNGMDNCYDLSTFAGTALGEGDKAVCVQGLSYNQSIAGSTVKEQNVSYELVGGALPEGLSLSEDGLISGKAVAAGEYSFKVKVTVSYWVNKTETYTIKVTDALDYVPEDAASQLGSAKVGQDFEGVFEAPYFKTTADGGDYETIKFEAANLPAGISVADGVIYGTPTEAGTYEFTVTLVATKYVAGSGSNPGTYEDERVSRTFVMTVAEADPEPVVLPKVTLSLNGGTGATSATVNADGTVAVPAAPTREGYEFTGWYLDSECTAVASFQASLSSDVTYYAGWKEVTEATPAPATESTGGCGSAIQSGVAILAGLVVVAGAAVVVKAAKKHSED